MFDGNIKKWAAKRGYKTGIGEVNILDKVTKELEQKKDRKEIDPLFFKDNLSFFEKNDDLASKQGQTVIIVALPRPAHYVGFILDSKIIKVILPPTYFHYHSTFETIRRDMKKNVFNENVEPKTLNVSLKLLANYLGIVSYGKNNLAYIPDFGSYFQLVGYLVNAPFRDKKSAKDQKRSLMKECENCSACSKACPMGAISKDRFLLFAEKCYTLYSESSNNFPDDVRPPSPNCIFGCLKCQEICPKNRGKLKYENSGIMFSEEETQAVLTGKPISRRLSDSIKTKYKSMGLTENSNLFFRNLRVLWKHKKI
jgi:epoxyqueuosine reductase